MSTREHVVLMRRPRKEVSLSDRGICQKVLCGAGKTDNFILESTARIASIFVSSTAVHTYDFHIFTVIYSFRYIQTMRWNWLGLTLFFKVMFTVVFFFLSSPASSWLCYGVNPFIVTLHYRVNRYTFSNKKEPFYQTCRRTANARAVGLICYCSVA